MANIKKSFNFRNGVQVDDDNLKVSATGLVGIGTTVPTEALDVRGNLVVSGVSSAVTLQAGVATITTLNPTEIIGAGVSIKSGIVTASSGIITFFGDGINLLNLPTSQWEDTIVGAGVSSIYNTGGNVGIATTAALFTLQIGNDVNSGQEGVGISSFGDIKASGIATATGFVGALTGDVTGNVTGNLTGNVTGNLNGVAASATQLQTARTIGGVSFDGTANINLPGVNIAGNQNTSGTAANLSGNPNINITDLDVDGHTNLDNVSIAGVTTFAGRIEGVATNNVIPFLYGNQGDLPSASSYHGAVAHVHATGALYFAHAGAWWELVNKESDGRVGTGTETYNVANINSSGIITATTELNSPLIGVGTDTPANDIQVRKSGNTEIQVTSDTGVAGLTVGRESGTGDTNNAEFRYGGGAGASYSSGQSLDILNYGTGNFNYHISANNAGAVAGDFHWHRGKNNARLMTLTGIGGSLGIGITTPTQALHVAGNGFIAGNLTVDDTLTASTLVVNSTVNFSNIICGTVAGTLIGNTNSTSGISTFNRLKTTSSNSNFAGIGIKTDNTSSLPFDLYGNGSSSDTRVFITDNGRIGIKTSTIDNGVDISAVTSRATISSVGIGTTNPQSAVDMRHAGKELTGIFANRMYMYPPQVTNTQRGNLAGVAAGAVIYNTTTNKLQVYNGSAWQDCN